MTFQPCVYILASRRNGTLYTGVTSGLASRIQQHRDGTYSSFTSRYRVDMLVWYELHDTMETAIAHEKRIKRWLRKWKLDLIERDNPNWRDLYEDLNS